MKKRASLAAVHDDDLDGFLRGLGVFEEIRAQHAKCKFCRSVVGLGNLAAVFPESGDIKFACSEPECLNALAQHRAETRGPEAASVHQGAGRDPVRSANG